MEEGKTHFERNQIAEAIDCWKTAAQNGSKEGEALIQLAAFKPSSDEDYREQIAKRLRLQ